jgi:hypothetical protein
MNPKCAKVYCLHCQQAVNSAKVGAHVEAHLRRHESPMLRIKIRKRLSYLQALHNDEPHAPARRTP